MPQFGGGDVRLVAVNTTEDLEKCITILEDLHYPLAVVLRSTPPEARRLYDLLVDDIYDVVVTMQGVLEPDPEFFAVQDLFKIRANAELGDVSYDFLFKALELSALQPWLVRPARENLEIVLKKNFSTLVVWPMVAHYRLMS